MTDYAKMSTDELLEELVSQAKDVGEYSWQADHCDNGMHHSLRMASQAEDRIIRIKAEIKDRIEEYGL